MEEPDIEQGYINQEYGSMTFHGLHNILAGMQIEIPDGVKFISLRPDVLQCGMADLMSDQRWVNYQLAKAKVHRWKPEDRGRVTKRKSANLGRS